MAGAGAWLPRPVSGDPPLTAGELQRLLWLETQRTPEHERRGGQAFPAELVVPTQEEVRELADRVGRFAMAARQVDPRLREVLDRADVDTVLAAIKEVDEAAGQVLGRGRPWVVRATDEVLADPDGETVQRIVGHAEYVERAVLADRELAGATIEGVEPSEAGLEAVTALADRLDDGEALKRRFRSRAQRAAAPWLDQATIDGEPVVDATGVAMVATHLRVYAEARGLARELAPLGASVPTAGPRDDVVAAMVEIREGLEAVARLADAAQRFMDLLTAVEGATAFEVRSLDDIDTIRWAGGAMGTAHDAGQARAELARLAARLEEEPAAAVARGEAAEPAPEVAELVLCLQAADVVAFGDWLVKLEAGRRLHRLEQLRGELRRRLAERAPGVVALIDADRRPETWRERVAGWEQAWEEARRTPAEPAADTPAPETPAPEAPAPEAPAPAELDPDDPRAVVLRLVADGPATSAQVREATGLTVTRVRRLLQEMVAAGELVRTGATSATRYHRAT